MPKETPPDDAQTSAIIEKYQRDLEQGVAEDLEHYLRMFSVYNESVFVSDKNTAATPAPLRIGPFVAEAELGRGGQGIVYKATDTRFGRTVALKVLLRLGAGAEDVIERFRREATVASRLQHPGICGVLDAQIDDGVPYIAMPFVRGETLAKRIERSRRQAAGSEPTTVPEGASPAPKAPRPAPDATTTSSISRLEIVEVVRLFEKAARALHAAHVAGVIHRDIKPANIMINEDREPVLLDFGLARSQDNDLESLTLSGDLFGTPAYMSPEQVAASDQQIDHRTDIYSLGATLFEALVLRRPFEEPTREAQFHAITRREAPSVRRFNRRVPRDLAVVVATTLQKNREDRYDSALDLAEELRRVRELEPIVARPSSFSTRTWRWARRHPAVASLLVALLAVLGTSAASIVAQNAALAEESRLKSGALEDWERLADQRRLNNARSAANALWPVEPGMVLRARNWLDTYSELEDRYDEHRRALERLASQAEPYSEAARHSDHASRIEQLAAARQELADHEAASTRTDDEEGPAAASPKPSPLRQRIASLEAQTAERLSWSFGGDIDLEFKHQALHQLVEDLGEFIDADRGLMAGVRARIQRAGQLAWLSRESPAARHAWQAAQSRITQSATYGGLKIDPQFGLFPLGPDPRSGLEEFLHLDTHQVDWEAESIQIPQRRPPEEASPNGGMVMTPGTGIIFVLLPPQLARFGSQKTDPNAWHFDPAGRSDESPVQQLDLESFFISKYEMTQGQWARAAAWVGDLAPRPCVYGPGSFKRQKDFLPRTVDGSHPVETVSWHDCDLLCTRLGLELPTEAQWEAAARGGRTNERWSGVDSLAALSRFANVAGIETAGPTKWAHTPELRDAFVIHAPVGSFEPNPFGLHDMSGNVFEWCRDPYITRLETERRAGDGFALGPSRFRVNRGGCFILTETFARVSNRSNCCDAQTRQATLGFRPARRLAHD